MVAKSLYLFNTTTSIAKSKGVFEIYSCLFFLLVRIVKALFLFVGHVFPILSPCLKEIVFVFRSLENICWKVI